MFLLIDIGGTKVRIAISKDRKTLEGIHTIETNPNFEEAIDSMRAIIEELTKGEAVEAAAGGVRALSNDKKTLMDQPNFPLWVNEPLHQKLQEIIQAPLFLENDAAMAGLGEAIYGEGKGKNIIAYLTISTGIGGARIVKGQIDANFLGFEPGNQIVSLDEKGPIYLENLASGSGLKNKYGKQGQDIHDPDIWDQTAKDLALGLNNITVLWSPEIIILGGSVMDSLPLDKLRNYTKAAVKIFPKIPLIKRAKLGEESGLYGALAYLNTKAL